MLDDEPNNDFYKYACHLNVHRDRLDVLLVMVLKFDKFYYIKHWNINVNVNINVLTWKILTQIVKTQYMTFWHFCLFLHCTDNMKYVLSNGKNNFSKIFLTSGILWKEQFDKVKNAVCVKCSKSTITSTVR